MPGLRPVVRDRSAVIRLVVALNVTTLLNWTSYFESLRRIDVILVAAIVVGQMPLWMLVLLRAFDGRRISGRDLSSAGLVLVGVALIAFDHAPPQWDEATQGTFFLGLGLAVVSSLFAAANNWVVGRLNRFHFGTAPVFASRFWLLLLASFGLAAFDGFAGVPREVDDWTFAIVLGLWGMSLPVLCLQGAIRRLGPGPPTLLIAFHPVCVLCLQLVLWLFRGSPEPPGPKGLLGVVTVTAGVFGGIRSLQRAA
jgi:drug/metabolite transporter (DMT)-like permease